MEFNKYRLKDLAEYKNERIETNKLTTANYISTENLLANKQGKQIANNLPSSKTVKKYTETDILISNIRPYFKKIWQADNIGGISNDVLNITSSNEKVSNDYLYYYLSQDKFFQYMTQTSRGTKMPRGDKEAIMEFEIKVPKNITHQNFISSLGKSLDNKIEVNKKIIANLEELSQTLFKRWFVDFEFPDKNGNPYKSSGGEMINSELGEIPLNWKVNELKNIADIRTGYAFKSSEYVYSSKLSVLRTLNISKTSCLIEMNNLKFVSNDYINIPKYNKYSLKIFDTLLVTVGGSIGNIGIITESNLPSLQNQNMWRFRSLNSKINNPLIYNIIKIINQNVSNQTSGSAREFYTKKVFENFKIVFPNLNHPILLKANQIHSNFFNHISNLDKETKNLVKLRDILLSKLMSGEIEIPDDIEVNTDELSI
ncbi:restriction endonuclease subunit S [Staphylococcus capitis]|uniref:restriction endonuclease subunit S n=1 Tax=Staphylococcus capitis TaxID=29388 RepID=UPI0018892CC6|nr:restriction endonuclease subunit S [Staphylococcus capitis]MBF2240744.1 restriction endonuclease subunit S [Staphylococcus capitis]MBF2243944.1 restriction endonuclease subunit S [Staphylococcus capitis]MBF2249727.1 restriction endonuclease subunit S [Staphylococcus capitis]MBF2251193.1 restriction endonuclease subunit S [Staphylococcus capitis]MBF2257790.1 restriction endonuclease subunit S [Staphylococcus capitis]